MELSCGLRLALQAGFAKKCRLFCPHSRTLPIHIVHKQFSPLGNRLQWLRHHQTLTYWQQLVRKSCPVVKIHSHISIACAASQHLCIDISLESAVIGPDGLKRSWPAQIFNLA